MAFADADLDWGGNGTGVGSANRVFYEQSDGKFLASDIGEQTRHLVRLNADGSYDTSFSGDGRVPFASGIVAARQVADNKIIIAYTYSRELPDPGDGSVAPDDLAVYGYGVARFTARGKPDTTFSDDGLNAVTFKSANVGRFADLAGTVIAVDGSVYVAVSTSYLNILGDIRAFSSFVFKFDPSGNPDTTWGTNGVVTLPSKLRVGESGDFARIIGDIGLDGSGRLLVSGTEIRFDSTADRPGFYRDTAEASAFVTRLNSDGKTDTQFATAGTFKADKRLDESYDDGTSDKVIARSDGRVLLVTRVDDRLRVFTLTNAGQPVDALDGPQADNLAGGGQVSFAKELTNGSLIVGRTDGVLFELRKTDTGYAAQAPKLPAGPDGRIVGVASYNASTVLPTRDGSVVLGAYAGSVKIDAGDGRTPREDDLPFGRQNSISTPDAGSQTDIPQLDAFYHDARGGLKYRQRTPAGRWGDAQTVDAAMNAGTYLSAIGTNVVYTDGDTADLKFAKRLKNGKWRTETIDARGSTGFYCSLVALADDTLIATYYDRTHGDLRLARRDGTTGVWTSTTIDSAGNVGRYAKLVVRPDGGLSVAYATGTTGGVRLAEQKRGKWVVTDLAANGFDVDGLDVGYFLTNTDPEAYAPSVLQATVAFYDANAGDLIVGYRPTAKGKFRLVREKTKGVVGLNPHVLASASAVSFFDPSRDRVLSTRIVEQDAGRFSLKTDPDATVIHAGAFANPVFAYADPDITNGYVGSGYASAYAWVNDDGTLQIRGPV